MTVLVIYSVETGEIQQLVSPPPAKENWDKIMPAGCAALTTTQRVKGKTHCVSGGKVRLKSMTKQDSEETAKAWRDLRVRRYSLLMQKLDTINAVRWAMMDRRERKAWMEYRQALLDMPETTSDPRNPTWPEAPK